jgi:hypothetical protein
MRTVIPTLALITALASPAFAGGASYAPTLLPGGSASSQLGTLLEGAKSGRTPSPDLVQHLERTLLIEPGTLEKLTAPRVEAATRTPQPSVEDRDRQ